MDLLQRSRRLRGTEALRRMVRETRADASSLIYPAFVCEGENVKEEIPSMPGQYRWSLDRFGEKLEELSNAGVGAVMILTQSPVKALLFLVFIVVLQQLEGNLIYPKVVGNSIGLPALWVLAAITVGGSLMGITGMLLGVPLAAALYRLIREDLLHRETQK